jgi:hypothetical protein
MLAKFLTLICLCLFLVSPACASNKAKKRMAGQSSTSNLQNFNNSMLPYYLWSRGGSRRGPSYGFGYGGPVIVSPSAFGYPVGGF